MKRFKNNHLSSYLTPYLLYALKIDLVGFYGISTIVGYCYGPGRGHKENRTPQLLSSYIFTRTKDGKLVRITARGQG